MNAERVPVSLLFLDEVVILPGASLILTALEYWREFVSGLDFDPTTDAKT